MFSFPTHIFLMYSDTTGDLLRESAQRTVMGVTLCGVADTLLTDRAHRRANLLVKKFNENSNKEHSCRAPAFSENNYGTL